MNIFTKIQKTPMKKDFENLYELFSLKPYQELGQNKRWDGFYSIKEYINDKYFMDWKYRNSYNDLEELIENLNSYNFNFNDAINFLQENELEELFFQFVELILNLINPEAYLTPMIKNDLIDNSREGKPFKHIINSIKDLSIKYNLEVKEVNDRIYINKKNFEDTEKIITDKEILNEIYRYRSPSTQGQLIIKQEILCIIYPLIEQIKCQRGTTLYNLQDKAMYLFNKCKIRHATDRKAASILNTDEEIEKIYDLAFDCAIHFLTFNYYSKNDDFYKEIKNKIDNNK